ncbi:DUF4920 domain-containing protein [Chitinophaga nivalis]|uniref:DUF4920 domain-containing protein n=1 Tax=Chitinophaga nivalis TaxID=2991709 RepID=A0ABT3IND3_9BACT|nr:DUF4920 domain-containing protein [Chitinophaga nivalis]MCW3464856.1 DUF4920 domain-containing protein [Chitinophaga nivalis]MCW3485453.1 DUF4920 domain-containing protein [Chitinophaga nivalis]
MMKHRILTAFLVMGCMSAYAQLPQGPAKPGTSYGAATTTKDAIAIAQLPDALKTQPNLTTKVKAKVLDVCPKKGCWMKLAVNDSTTAFVKMKDYGFFVPLDMIGKTVVIDGDAFIKETSVKELQHYAEDAKKSPEEIAAIQQPKKEIRLTAKGILVVE